MQRLAVIVILCAASLVAIAQTTPVEGLRDKTPDIFALTNATVTVAPGRTIEHATVIVRDHRIAAVGANLAVPADAIAIDATGKFIYAAFIEPFSDYGVGAGKPDMQNRTDEDFPTPTIDRKGAVSWNGAVHPERMAAMMFKPDEKNAEKLRANGFAIAQTASLDGIFRGSSCVVSLANALPNECLIPAATHQFLSFDKGSSKQDYPSSLMGAIALIRQTLYDAQWYAAATKAYGANAAQNRPERNDALAALQPCLDKTCAVVVDAGNLYNMFRAKKIADEFGLSIVLKGQGFGYKRLNELKELGLPIIVPVAFPDAPNVSTTEDEAQVAFIDLKNWDVAPENPGRLEKAGVMIALTSYGLKDQSAFLKNVRTAIKRGLSADGALAALTTTPAKLCGIEGVAGTLETGKAANMIVSSAPIFDDKATIYTVWVDGHPYDVNTAPDMEPRGTWSMKITQSDMVRSFTMDVAGEQLEPEITIKNDAKGAKASSINVTHRTIGFAFSGDSIGWKGTIRLSGTISGDSANGYGVLEDGGRVFWSAVRSMPFTPKPDTAKKDEPLMALYPTTFPDKPFGRLAPPERPHHVAVKNATLWTAADKGIIKNGTIVIGDGKIIAAGADVQIPSDAIVIDGAGKHVSPGIIDEHSHIAIDGEVNEGTQAISAEVRLGDVIDPDDVNLYRQLGGGTTISHLLHGSANPIGGQCVVVKHRWGLMPEEMKVPEADPSIKFALGENVKQSNWGDRFTSRYPQSRMGVEQIMRDEFQTAREYDLRMKEWQAHPLKNMVPPRRDIELDAVVEIINGVRKIHCHSYVQSEILMLMRLAEDFNFRMGTFTHILEGYKLAPEMRKHGVMASSFSDWWDYKFEVYDAIPYNAAMLEQEGVVTAVNSDDAEMGRRLNQEAAKSVKYGGLSQEEAIKLCTINPAKTLGIEKIVGSLEPGKDADIVIWDDSPLSAHAKVLQTWVDGRKYFDRDEDRAMQEELRVQRAALVARAAKAKGGSGHGENAMGKREQNCGGGSH